MTNTRIHQIESDHDLSLDTTMSPEALYIHIPFCFHKCHYCDFYSLADQASNSRHSVFIDKLIDEMRYWANRMTLQPETIFIGGGTPTMLSVAIWQKMGQALQDIGALENVEEFTVEANPETVSTQIIQAIVEAGANRISIGSQSFQLPLLRTLERHHEPSNVKASMDIVRHEGIDNINLDMIFAIPGQTMVTLETDLETAISLEPTHMSYYGLTYEPNTALTERRRNGAIDPIDDETERNMYKWIMDRMSTTAFEHYEVSSWAAPNHSGDHPYQCRHNLMYWTNRTWLGLGPSAASHLNGQRWKNVPHLGQYLRNEPAALKVDYEAFDQDRCIGEQLMMTLRLRKGINLEWIQSQVPVGTKRRQMIDELVSQNLLAATNTHLRLTPQGLFLADSVISELL